MKPKVAVVLGGTFPHRKLINNLKLRGYHTVLVDYYEQPCAADCADEHIQESTLDVEKVFEIAQNANAALVISSCVDQANVIACTVSERLGLPHPYSTEIANIVTNKTLMKRFMLDKGIPTSRYIAIKDFSEDLICDLSFPLIVKPADSNSSKGVKRADSIDELKDAVSNALALSRSGEVIVEEFVEGVEIGIDCYVQDKSVSVLMTKQRRKIPAEKDSAQQIYGCTWPARITQNVELEIQRIAIAIASSLSIKNCPLMIQAIVHGNSISVIEFAARFGGGESCTIIEAMTGVDIIDLSVSSFLGEIPWIRVAPCADTYAETFLYASQGVFGKIELQGDTGPFDDNILCVNTYKTPGMAIGDTLSSNNRVGAIILRAKSYYDIEVITKVVLKNIDVIDVCGHTIMRKDLY